MSLYIQKNLVQGTVGRKNGVESTFVLYGSKSQIINF
jgi:hypothetical protein